MAEKPAMDRLTGQLYHLPFIIGQMGLSIANAQKAFNVDYVENVSKLMALIERTLGHKPAAAGAGAAAGGGAGGAAPTEDQLAAVKTLLEALAPSRYQFTEATLDFSADLAETLDVAGQAGLGFGTAAITVNAAFSLGYGYDYRAAARVTAKLHAISANAETAKALLARAGEIDKGKLALPQLTKIEKEVWDGVTGVYNALTKQDVKKVKAEDPTQDA